MTENPSAPSTEQALLLATIECINEHGIENVTTRLIAEEAGANIASINYYYRTKDHLIDKAMEITIHHMLEDVMLTLEDESLPFRETLTEVFFYIIDGANSNRGISTAHLYSLVVEKNYESVSGRAFTAAFEGVLARSIATFPDIGPEKLRLVLASVIAAIMFMMLAPGYFRLSGEARQGTQEGHRALAEHFTSMYYAALAH